MINPYFDLVAYHFEPYFPAVNHFSLRYPQGVENGIIERIR